MPAVDRSASRKTLLCVLTGLLAGTLACTSACAPETDNTAPAAASPVPAAATYVGNAACAGCHEAAMQAWLGSHHDLALQQADTDTVLAPVPGSFSGMRLSQQGQGFAIRPDAESAALPLRYTFGVEPLQQYIVQSEGGHLQLLPYPWDTRPKAEGGQRWYALYPGEYPAGDPMHWHGRANSWNAMCADCHSTGFKKHYDPETHTYQSTFVAEDVSCEACHGPGSGHVAAANGESTADVPYAGLSTQSQQINACAPCHSRRSQLSEGFKPDRSFFDFYRPSLIQDGLYHDDGQILDEVYVWGSFLQSRMHRKGVKCSDCHEPHSATLKFAGNALCTQCHNTAVRPDFPGLKAALYDDPAHYFHPAGSAGSACIACHMPARTYMGVDQRNDHSFRLPRPDLSAATGVPNACANCHEERSSDWAAQRIHEKFGPRPDHYGTVFHAVRNGDPFAATVLAAVAADDDQAIMVRASALSKLAYSIGDSLEKLDALWIARAGHPLMRLGVVEGVAGLSAERQWQILQPMLDDEYLSVRSAAFSSALALVGNDGVRQVLQQYLPAYLEAQQASLDFPETQINIANAQLAFGNTPAAEHAYRQALRIQANFVPALMNLADLYRATQRDDKAEALLQKAMLLAPESPEPVFAYAMWLTRQQRSAEALQHYRTAAALGPEQVRFGYTLAVALNDAGEKAAAIALLQDMLTRWPNHPDLVSFHTILQQERNHSN